MSEFDALPADQRAVLQLLLKQGKNYAELSTLLAIDASAVQVRAHDALDALSPGSQLSYGQRAQVADYLLGQQSTSEREATEQYLASSDEARAWGRDVAGALRPIAVKPLPAIPGETAVDLAAEPEVAEPIPAEPADTEAAPAVAAPPRSSRLGGALLLGGVGVLVAVALVLILGGGGDSKKTSSTATRSTAQPTPVAQINLMPTAGGKSVGLAQVFPQGTQRLLIVAAQSLPPGNYALWLYTSAAKARLLGFVPQKVDKQGRFVTQGVLPGDARSFESLIVTREQVTRGNVPTRPGAIALRGKLQTG
ncbi:MAG: anti-sigma factor [Actinomycetota bacterium]|nr:anti-sigma factor [Actinomycetota bacterium]